MGSLVASPRVVKGLYGTRRGAGPYGLTHRRLGGGRSPMGPAGRRDLMEVPRTAFGDEGFLWGGPQGTESVGEKTQGGAFLHRLPFQESLRMGGSHRFSLWRTSRGSDLMGAWRSGDCRQYGEVIFPRTGVGAEAPPNLLPPASHVRQVISPRGRRTPAGRRRARASPRERARRTREKAPREHHGLSRRERAPSLPPDPFRAALERQIGPPFGGPGGLPRARTDQGTKGRISVSDVCVLTLILAASFGRRLCGVGALQGSKATASLAAGLSSWASLGASRLVLGAFGRRKGLRNLGGAPAPQDFFGPLAAQGGFREPEPTKGPRAE